MPTWNSDQLTWFSWATILNCGYTSRTLIGPIWSRSVRSHVLFTLVLSQLARAATSNERLQPVVCNVFLAVFFSLSHHHVGEIWGWSDSTVTHLDPSAAEWRRRRQPESSGAVAAEKQMARRRASRNWIGDGGVAEGSNSFAIVKSSLNKIKITVITHNIAPVKLRLSHSRTLK